MVSATMTPPYYPSSADSHFFEDKSMLDHNMGSAVDMSPTLMSRRESSGVASFSPKQEDSWAVEMQSQPSSHSSIGPTNVAANGTAAFYNAAEVAHAQQIMGAANAGNWVMSQNAAGMVGVDGLMPGQFDDMNSFDMFQNQAAMMGNAGPAFAGMGLFGGMVAPAVPGAATGMSMGSVHSMDVVNTGGVTNGSKKTPAIQAALQELRRGDGIRKKNARFEIPADRKLSNIDHLIAQSTDEQEIKELKQQKRLLRNRQAALDSRYRKKMHTERLEDEKKQYTAIIADFEEQVSMLRKEVERLHHDKQQYENYVQGLTLEKETLLREHTRSDAELHKKVAYLASYTQRLENDLSNYRGHKTSTSPLGANLDGYATPENNSPPPIATWDTTFFDLGIETDIKQEAQTPATPTSQASQLASMNQTELSLEDRPDGIARSGNGPSSMLFMLFLVGAYVVSNRSTEALPAVTDHLRGAASSMLASLFKDAGVSTSGGNPAVISVDNQWTSSLLVDGTPVATPLHLKSLGDILTQPSHEQNNEQLFSLNSATYGHSVEYVNPAAMTVTGAHALGYGHPNPSVVSSAVSSALSSPVLGGMVSKDQRNLAGSLTMLRSGASVADAYQRSLLREQIPVDVVRNFAQMVAEGLQQQQQQQQQRTRSIGASAAMTSTKA